MTDGNNRKKAQAVFFSLVMVLSMVGGSVALAGSAAASTTSIELSDTLVQGGDVDVNGTVDSNGTVHAFIDEDGDGNYTGASDASESVNIEDYENDNEFSISLSAPGESGTYDVYVFQDEGETDSTIDEDDEGERSAQLQVDADAPTFGNETPEDGSTITSADEIVVPIEDANTSVQTVTATVENADGTIKTYEISPETAAGDGVSWDGSELVIEPGVGNVPSIADGSYDVSVSATDEVGNSDSIDFSFTVDSVAPTSSFDLPDQANDENENLTNDVNETVSVSLDASANRNINDSTVSLEIEGPSYSESFDYEDSAYTNSSDEFSVTPDGDEVPSFNDGEYDVIVSAEDDIGNSFEETYNFEVDTSQITATDVTLSEDDLNSDSDDPTVTVEFGEDVDASEVSAEVIIDGASQETLAFTETNSDEAVATLDLSEYGTVENDSAIVNVTSAQDVAGNGLINPADSDSQTHFEIDTDGPSVGLEGLPNGGTLSGYVNVTDFVDSAATEDVAHTRYYIEVAEDDRYPVEITDSAENLDTTALLDGDHRLVVEVTDDNGNTASTEASFNLDNGQSLTVDQEYLEGGFAAFDHEVTEETVTVSDLFTSTSNIEYTVDGEDANDTDVISAEDNRGQVVSVTASSAGEERTVTLDFGPLVGAESVEDDTIDIGVESNEDLSALNVTLETDDNYVDQSSYEYTIDDFDEHETDNGYIYSLTEEDLRDGDYTVTVTDSEDADGDDVAIVGLDGDTDATVSDDAPSLIDADIVGVDSGQSQVQLTFSEPLGSVFGQNDASFADDRAADIGGNFNASAGTAVITFDREIQTGDDPELVIDEDSYTDTTGTVNDADSVVVDSAELDLTEGANFVSVPVETGAVPLDEVDTSNVDAIWAYDDGEWESFDPDADENDFDALEAGQGYVLYADSDTTVDVRGYTVIASNTDDGPTAPAVENLQTGWNLVGHFQEGTQPADRALTTIDQVSEVGVLGQASQYSVQTVDSLAPGESYWVFVESEDQYVRTTYADADQSPAPSINNAQTDVQTGSDDTAIEDDTVEVSAEVTDANLAGVYIDATELGAEGTEEQAIELQQVAETDTYSATFDIGQDTDITADDGDVPIPIIAVDEDGITTDTTTNVTYDANQLSTSVDVTDTGNDEVVISVSSNEELSTLEVSGSNIGGPYTLSDFTDNYDSDGTYNLTVGIVTGTVTEYSANIDSAGDANHSDDNDSGASDAVTIDDEAPMVNTITTLDTNDNGDVDAANVTFSEAIDNSTLSAGNWTIGGNTVDTVDTLGSDDDKIQLQLADGNEVDGTDAKEVTYSPGSTADIAGNALAAVDSGTVNEFDGAEAQIDSATATTGSTDVSLTFSEGVYAQSGETGTLADTDFAYNDVSGDNAASISSVTHSTAGDAGVTITLNTAVQSSDIDTDEISIDGIIYDANDNEQDTGTTTYTAA